MYNSESLPWNGNMSRFWHKKEKPVRVQTQRFGTPVHVYLPVFAGSLNSYTIRNVSERIDIRNPTQVKSSTSFSKRPSSVEHAAPYPSCVRTVPFAPTSSANLWTSGLTASSLIRVIWDIVCRIWFGASSVRTFREAKIRAFQFATPRFLKANCAFSLPRVLLNPRSPYSIGEFLFHHRVVRSHGRRTRPLAGTLMRQFKFKASVRSL